MPRIHTERIHLKHHRSIMQRSKKCNRKQEADEQERKEKMKKMKKILAFVMAMAMVLGMSVTSLATDKKPSDADRGSITITNITEASATIKGYKIVKADYNSAGFAGYSKVNSSDNFDIYKPTAEQITTLAKSYSTKDADFSITSGTLMTNETTKYSYTKSDLAVGTYLILVSGTNDVVYNPMVVSVSYKTEGDNISGSWNDAEDGELNAEVDWDNWGVSDATVYAKSSEVKIEKKVEDKTVNRGEVVKFTVTTKIPDYSDEYKTESLKFEIKDTMSNGLILVTPTDEKPFNVAVGNTESVTKGTDTYSLSDITDGSTTYTLSFVNTFIKAHRGEDVTITYWAKASGTAVNQTPLRNDVELTYTHNTETGEDGEKKTGDTERVYTFDIDGESTLTSTILKKVQEGKFEQDGTMKSPLQDAEFTLYTDNGCTIQYTNDSHVTGTYTAKSDAKGKIYISGLAEGTYYLKETKAPNGFSLTDKIFRIKIDANFNKDASGKETTLDTWSVKVAEITVAQDGTESVVGTENTWQYKATETKSENNFAYDASRTDTDAKTTEISNTKLSSLPSTGGIGTTIFTIGGCAIMIVAAGLFFASRRKSTK